MRIAILEDEPLAIQRIKDIIFDQFPDFKVVGVAQSIGEAKDLLTDLNYDLLLSDIHLADGLSFEVFQEINIPCPTIFITAYNDYAIRSFEHNCLDYILKPINEEKFKKALNKAYSNFKGKSSNLVPQELIDSLLEFHKSKTYKRRFICKMGNSVVFKNAEDIAYFFIDDKVIFVQDAVSNKKYIINHSLDELETELLDPYMFYRINRSTIVNLNHLLEMKKYNNGRLKLIINPNSQIELIVARERVSSFKEWINQ